MQEFRQYREFKPGELIVAGGDLATGCGDYSVTQFYSKTNFDYPLVYSSFKMGTEMINVLHPVLEKIADITGFRPVVAPERNNGGVFETERLMAMNRLNKYEIFRMPTVGTGDPGRMVKMGWDTNSATRPEMLSVLKQSIDNGIDRIYDKPTIEELYSFIIVQSSSGWKAQAERKAHDDHIMAMAIAKIVSTMIKDIEVLRIEKKRSEYETSYPKKKKYVY
ncbi:MAG: hypothetical protein WCY09_08050 [Candidatus Omnitrophota bacterium]